MPCDYSPSPFDVRSHYNISHLDILSIELLVTFAYDAAHDTPSN
jgi:hypothetical protein